ncbi:hypothetical protein AB0B10_25845 [Micromonospora arborensis]|uniref:hypothetical protein n=1 Tax=Micromonospora arborensis TaxID=2116518 RepID=UPI0033F1BDA4
MEKRTIDGQAVTDRAGAAEHLGLPLSSVRVISAPKQREKTGFPAPVDREDGRDWFAVKDLDAYQERKNAQARAVPAVTGDPNELIDTEAFAEILGVKKPTMHRYVDLSRNDWDQGRDGYLPLPDETEAASRGVGSVYRWRRGRVADRVAEQRKGGRRSGPAPTVEDLAAVVDEAMGRGEELTGREIAARMTERLGRDVSLQSVRRLQRRRREGSPSTRSPRR